MALLDGINFGGPLARSSSFLTTTCPGLGTTPELPAGALLKRSRRPHRGWHSPQTLSGAGPAEPADGHDAPWR